MIRILGPVGVLLTGFWLYCLVDAILANRAIIRNLPKATWVVITFFGGPIGGALWLAFGRPLGAGWFPGDDEYRPKTRARGPEDSDQWSRGRPPFVPARPASDPELDEKERRYLEWEAEMDRLDAERAAAEADADEDDTDSS